MSSRKQQALDRLLDVSGPGCFNEVTGTWMVGRRHHHHHHHVSPTPSTPEPSPEPEAPPQSPTTTSPVTTTPSGGFYPDITAFRGKAVGAPTNLSPGARFSTTNIYPNLPSTAGAKAGSIRRNYVCVTRVNDPGGWPRSYTFALLP